MYISEEARWEESRTHISDSAPAVLRERGCALHGRLSDVTAPLLAQLRMRVCPEYAGWEDRLQAVCCSCHREEHELEELTNRTCQPDYVDETDVYTQKNYRQHEVLRNRLNSANQEPLRGHVTRLLDEDLRSAHRGVTALVGLVHACVTRPHRRAVTLQVPTRDVILYTGTGSQRLQYVARTSACRLRATLTPRRDVTQVQVCCSTAFREQVAGLQRRLEALNNTTPDGRVYRNRGDVRRARLGEGSGEEKKENTMYHRQAARRARRHAHAVCGSERDRRAPPEYQGARLASCTRCGAEKGRGATRTCRYHPGHLRGAGGPRTWSCCQRRADSGHACALRATHSWRQYSRLRAAAWPGRKRQRGLRAEICDAREDWRGGAEQEREVEMREQRLYEEDRELEERRKRGEEEEGRRLEREERERVKAHGQTPARGGASNFAEVWERSLADRPAESDSRGPPRDERARERKERAREREERAREREERLRNTVNEDDAWRPSWVRGVRTPPPGAGWREPPPRDDWRQPPPRDEDLPDDEEDEEEEDEPQTPAGAAERSRVAAQWQEVAEQQRANWENMKDWAAAYPDAYPPADDVTPPADLTDTAPPSRPPPCSRQSSHVEEVQARDDVITDTARVV